MNSTYITISYKVSFVCLINIQSIFILVNEEKHLRYNFAVKLLLRNVFSIYARMLYVHRV